MATQKKQSLARRAWDQFSVHNVNDLKKKKAGLDYLSWTHAVQEFFKAYPESTFEMFEPVKYGDGTVEVRVQVTLREGNEELTKMMWLPVMDNRKKALANPDALAISNTKMRCLTKCISLFGLGLYIYSGEDLPDGEEAEGAAKKMVAEDLITKMEGLIVKGVRTAAQCHHHLTENFEYTQEHLGRLQKAHERFEAEKTEAAEEAVA